MNHSIMTKALIRFKIGMSPHLHHNCFPNGGMEIRKERKGGKGKGKKRERRKEREGTRRRFESEGPRKA